MSNNYESSNTSLILVFVFLILEYHLAFAWNHGSSCGLYGNYTNNGVYATNLHNLLSSLSTNLDDYGFYNASVGNSPDRVNAIVLCKGDIQLDTCRKCIENATFQLIQSCPNQMEAIFWDPDCMVRYSNEVIIGIMTTSPWRHSWYTRTQVTSPSVFLGNLRALIDDITAKAASSLHKVAGGIVKSADSQTIYALVQCTPDLTKENCSSCLQHAATDMSSCCSASIGVHMYAPSCILFYELDPFFNETRLQELGVLVRPSYLASSPLPSSPVRPKQSSTSSHSSDIYVCLSIYAGIFVVVVGLVILLLYLVGKYSTPSPRLRGMLIFGP